MATDYRLTTVLGDDEFLLAKLIGRERLGEPFRYEFHLLSENAQVDFERMIGTPVSLATTLGSDSSAVERHFSGIVTQISHVGGVRTYDHYVVIVRPNLWLLKQSADCRIFQEKSIPDIIKEVLRQGGVAIKDRLTENYPQVDYCVQYRESNFAFISRLMEQEGIYYYFSHSAGAHEMVLADASSAHEPISGENKVPYARAGAGTWSLQHVWEFQPVLAAASGMVVLTDYDDANPRASLEVRTQKLAAYDLEQGEVYDYPGKYVDTRVGETYSKVRLEALQAQQSLCWSEGNVRGLAAGGLFELTDHVREDALGEYLIVQNEFTLEVLDLSLEPQRQDAASKTGIQRGFQARFAVLPSNLPFRCPLATPRPVIGGPHTAIVVGPEREEIWTDKQGRIKVQFHWDRLGKKDENSTCWLRVAQGWAGMQWGSSFIPRIGQEVIVQFLEGDPDRPLVTGSLYNADQRPPFDVATQSGIRTRSSKNGDAENFNELRFEDEKDNEEIYLHAERNFTRIVENDDTLKVGFDKHDKGDQTIDIYNDRTVTLDQGNDKLQLRTGNRAVLIDKGKRTTTIAGDDSLTLEQGNHQIKVQSGKSTIEAAQSIELKVGNSSIKITPEGITLKALKIEIQGTAQVDVKSNVAVNVNAGAKLEAKGAMVNLQGQGVTTVKGGVVMIN